MRLLKIRLLDMIGICSALSIFVRSLREAMWCWSVSLAACLTPTSSGTRTDSSSCRDPESHTTRQMRGRSSSSTTPGPWMKTTMLVLPQTRPGKQSLTRLSVSRVNSLHSYFVKTLIVFSS